MESIIDQKQIDKVVELNPEFAKANRAAESLCEAVKITNEFIKSLQQLEKLDVDESKIDWKERYNEALELLTKKDNKIKELESEVDRVSISRGRYKEAYSQYARLLSEKDNLINKLKQQIIKECSTCEEMTTIISACKERSEVKITWLLLGAFIVSCISVVVAFLK